MTDDDVLALIDDPARRADVAAVELAEAFLARLEAHAELHTTITLTPELALAQARAADAARGRGRALPLDGMPLVVKDNIDIAGVPTTVGSRLFADRLAPSDADVTTRIRAAGGVILGTANLHELAFGATSANETFGAVVNPAAPDRIPGGSSGGSAAAVAADLCIAAIGTDTGGSVRLPASLCGVSGLRPTFGAVSTHGVQPVSVSLDTVGPLARSVTDIRRLLLSIAGSSGRLDLDPGTGPGREVGADRRAGGSDLDPHPVRSAPRREHRVRRRGADPDRHALVERRGSGRNRRHTERKHEETGEGDTAHDVDRHRAMSRRERSRSVRPRRPRAA